MPLIIELIFLFGIKAEKQKQKQQISNKETKESLFPASLNQRMGDHFNDPGMGFVPLL